MLHPSNDHDATNADPLFMPPGGRYAGQVMDASSRRSIAIRGPHEKLSQLGDTEETAVVDFFYHEETYWTAVIPLDGVDQVLGQAFNFSQPRRRKGPQGPEIVYDKSGLPKRRIPILNHLQCRFRLKPGCHVELHPLHGPLDSPPAHRLADFIYSVEAVGPPGVGFNLRDGLTGSLVSAHRLLSTCEMVFERIVVENQYVTESPPLPISEAAKRALLVGALLRSHRAGFQEPYYLYRVCGTNNCTSNPFQILDTVVEYSWRQRLGSILYRLPLNPRFYLRVRGLDGDARTRRLVRHEFERFVNDASVQQRKREYVRRKNKARREAQTPRNR